MRAACCEIYSYVSNIDIVHYMGSNMNKLCLVIRSHKLQIRSSSLRGIKVTGIIITMLHQVAGWLCCYHHPRGWEGVEVVVCSPNYRPNL